MKKAIIENNLVTNIIIADDTFQLENTQLIPCDDTTCIGDFYNGVTIEKLIPPEVTSLQTVEYGGAENNEPVWIFSSKFETTEQEAAFLAQENADAMAELKKACERAITERIQKQVDIYNKANDLTFENVHNCESYSRVSGYSHQAFCQAVWEWNVATWETARQILAQALAGEITIATPDDVIALLPEFNLEG